MAKESYKNDSIYPCIFIKRSIFEFVIIAIYIDNLNIIETLKELSTVIKYLKKDFEIEHLNNRIFMHQSTYLAKVLAQLYIDKAHSLSNSMIVRSLDLHKDLFQSQKNNEALFDPKVPYLSAIRALIYLASYAQPNILFSVNLLSRYNSFLTY